MKGSHPRQGDLFAAGAPAAARTPFADAADRQRAVTDFERPLLLEAGAGTGKTGTLIARLLAWCLGPGWERERSRARQASADELATAVLGGVLAITFTEAAAAEMSARFAAGLLEVERATRPPARRALDEARLPAGLPAAALPADAAAIQERARALRGALDHLNASTIHAYCRRLLAAHPLEAGLHPDFAVDAAGTRAALTVREVLEEELRGSGLGRELLELARRGCDPERLEQDLLELIDAGARASDFAGEPLDEATCRRLTAGVQGPLARLGALLPRLQPVGNNTPLAVTALEETLRVLAAPERAARARLEALCSSLPGIWEKRAWERLKKWSRGDLTQAETRALDDEAPELCAASRELRAALEPLLELDPGGLEAAHRVAHLLLGRVEARLRSSGTATFGELLWEARALLRDHPEIAAAERARVRHLLVDEFQDTDSIQCSIVRALALEGAPGERPCLFLVGDPKQSIFAWRNADLAAYDDFAAALEAAGGVRLSLSRNFRSLPEILAEVQRAVSPVMECVRGVQPGFAPLEAHRAGHAGDDPAVEYWISWTLDEHGAIDTRRGRKHRSYESEAAALAQDLVQHHGRDDLSWKDVALLFRSLTEIDPYLHALRRWGIPYDVQSDRRYYQRREVIDAGALVRAVLDPLDHLALVALLRSPLVGLPDAALFPLWERGFPGRMSGLRRPRPEALEALEAMLRQVARALPGTIPGLSGIAGWEESAVHAVRSIARLRASFRDLPLDRWLDELRALFLPEALESARYLGSWRLANLQRFFRDLLRGFEERGGDAHSLLRTLRANLARDDKSEAARPADSGRDAVKILTLHGAKGLEFRHVYFPQLHKGEWGEERFCFDRRAETTSVRLFGFSNPAWFETRDLRSETEAAERVRLLYVALTRARDRLVVLGACPLERQPHTWREARTFADLLENHPALEPALAALAERVARDERTPWIDESGARWSPTVWFEEETPARAAALDSLPVPLELAREDSARLRRARERARERAARPFHAVPSEEAHQEWAERLAERVVEEAPDAGRAGALGRDLAQAAGTAVHRALEALDLGLAPPEALEGGRALLDGLVRAALEDGAGEVEHAQALGRAHELWERFRESELAPRIFALEEHVLARELAVLLPPSEEPGTPVGFVSGAIDLLYRDPASGELVVADFKTDRVADERELEERARAHRPQGRLYTRAILEALGLEREPRFELWFLHAGRIVAV